MMKISKFILILLVLLFCTSCSTNIKTNNELNKTPTQFETGDEVSPPPGCIELRKRGGDC